MEKEIICTVCPRGCHIQVEGERETVRQVTGYICKRGWSMPRRNSHTQCVS